MLRNKINAGALVQDLGPYLVIRIEITQVDHIVKGIDVGTEPGTGFYEEQNAGKEPIHIERIMVADIGQITRVQAGVCIYFSPWQMIFAPLVWLPEMLLRIEVETPHTVALLKPVELVLYLKKGTDVTGIPLGAK